MTAPILAIIALLIGVQTPSDLPSLIFPPDDNAWVVRIVTSGGFTGRGAGNVTASSAGQVMCTLVATCPERLVPETNRVFSQLVTTLRHAEPRGGRSLLTPGGCSDCVTTDMMVQWRDADGEHVIRYTWDLSTVRTIPDAALRLHAALIGLTSPRSR
jgi:hypothetical protein